MNSEDPIENLKVDYSGCEFNLRGIPLKITVKFKEVNKKGDVAFLQSHFIKTPDQTAPYEPGGRWGHDAKDALEKVLQTFRPYYKNAVGAGNTPNESWLVENTRFYTNNWK